METKKYNIVEVLDKIIDYRGKTPQKSDEGIPTLSAKSVKMGYIDYSQCYYISKDEYERFMVRGLPKIGDILLTTEAPLGVVAKLDREDVAIAQRLLTLRCKKEILNNDYLLYYLQSSDGQQRLTARQSGSTVMGIRQDEFRKIDISLPSLATQKRISSVLSNLDRLISLKREENSTLEAMAKEIYDYWFVQFDFPDKNGKPYKSSGGKMVYNETLKREIPEGWEVKRLGEVADTYSGGTPNSTTIEFYDNGDIPWINSGELNSPFITSTTNFITKLGMDNSSAKYYPPKTILVAMYGATAGKVSLLSFKACSNQAVCGVIPRNVDLIYYLKFYLDSLYDYFVSISSGSARSNISQEIIKSIYVCIPENIILHKFHLCVSNSIELIFNNNQQIQSLTSLRDYLLPLLMNGQVEVKEAEEKFRDIVGEVRMAAEPEV